MTRALGDLVARLDAAMVIVTARSRTGTEGGCLCGFAGQCSIDPPRLVVWLSVDNATHRLAAEASTLAVHLVPADRHDLAAWFGETTGDEVDKLAPVPHHDGPAGTVLIDELPDVMVGRIVARLAPEGGGDHEGFVLAPIEVRLGPGDEPLRLGAVDDLEPGHPAAEHGA